jgi:hypothetical protein
MPILTHASILFHTNDEDKDDNSHVTVTVRDNDGLIVSRIDDDFGHFNNDSDNGPFSLEVINPSERATMNAGTITLRIDPHGNDTWRFNFSYRLRFSDGTTIAGENDGLELNQDRQQQTFGLG